MADGTTEFNAENVKDLAVIGYGIGKFTGKFTSKWGEIVLKVNNKI